MREKIRCRPCVEAWVKKKIKDAKSAAEENDGRKKRRAVILDENAKVPEDKQRCIRVGVLGVPNAGKSQLVNTLVGGAAPKVHTH
jgi:GTP-binding protein Era